jgi:hypothetical protein
MENLTKSTNGEKLNKFVYEKYQSNEITTGDLVELLILLFDLLGIKTINEYAKEVGKTYDGIKKYCKSIIKVNKFNFIIDND